MDALALRDATTSRHATAVARYAKALAVELGCDEEEQEVIHTAGLLHDIGKFAWSDRILHPDQLTEEDWAVIRRHPQDGAALVGKLDGYGPVADAILYHHERVDGGGYPAGLIGNEIPLASRIVAICSIYDTMTVQHDLRAATSLRPTPSPSCGTSPAASSMPSWSSASSPCSSATDRSSPRRTPTPTTTPSSRSSDRRAKWRSLTGASRSAAPRRSGYLSRALKRRGRRNTRHAAGAGRPQVSSLKLCCECSSGGTFPQASPLLGAGFAACTVSIRRTTPPMSRFAQRTAGMDRMSSLRRFVQDPLQQLGHERRNSARAGRRGRARKTSTNLPRAQVFAAIRRNRTSGGPRVAQRPRRQSRNPRPTRPTNAYKRHHLP